MRASRRRYKPSSVVAATFGGLNLAPGPLYYDGTTYQIANSWEPDSYGSIRGTSTGSYYFTISQLSSYFSSRGSSTYYDIDNEGNTVAYGGKSDWRMPTKNEWGVILGANRSGAIVNGTSSAKYAIIQLASGAVPNDSSIYGGILLFPDDMVISGKTLSGINNTTITSGVTAAEIQNYIKQGCIFMKCMGYYSIDGGNTWKKHTTIFCPWTTNRATQSMYWDVQVAVADSNYGTKAVNTDYSEGAYNFFPVWLVRTA